jgi:predicted regulator of Ras-like GTPase activity (Roadblock/LC7/MglB family)
VEAPPDVALTPLEPEVPSLPQEFLDVSKQADLNQRLREFHTLVDNVHGSVLATRDGLPIASTLADAQSTTVAAMAATVVALAHQAVPDGDDAAGHTVIRGSDGCLVVYPAGPLSVFAVQTGDQPNIGLLEVEAPAMAGELAALLG